MSKSIKHFVINGAPPEWHEYAQELMEAAQELYYHSDSKKIESSDFIDDKIKIKPALSRTIMLLIGLAIENSVKGYLISINPNYINTGILKTIKTHSIAELIKKIEKISFTKEEIEICKILQEAIPSWSRYPIPTKFEDIRKEHIIKIDFMSNAEKLFNKLQKILYLSYRNGWDSGIGISLTSSKNSIHEDI